jgi:ribosomal protein S18 acetylase RimI-like enzyme
VVGELPGAPRLRPATASDAAAVADVVSAAYGHYVERIGTRPGPMRQDYERVVRDQQVTVAEQQGTVVGVLVLRVTDEGFLIDNVAVHPSRQGAGLGRVLLALAEDEARRAGFGSIYLYTHEKMTENQELYRRIGYVEYDRRCEGGLTRVFMRKPLA